MTAGIENRVKSVGGNGRQDSRVGKFLLCLCVRLEPLCIVRLSLIGIARGVEGWLPTLGRGKRDIRAGILENIIRRSKFLKPVFLPVSPSLSCDVRTIKIFMLFALIFCFY